MDEYEYCVMRSDIPQEPHRGPMTKEAAAEWVREAIEEDGFKPGRFYVARRTVSPWEPLDD